AHERVARARVGREPAKARDPRAAARLRARASAAIDGPAATVADDAAVLAVGVGAHGRRARARVRRGPAQVRYAVAAARLARAAAAVAHEAAVLAVGVRAHERRARARVGRGPAQVRDAVAAAALPARAAAAIHLAAAAVAHDAAILPVRLRARRDGAETGVGR